MLTLPLHPVAPIRKRLWKLGFAVALAVLCLGVGNALIAPDKAVNTKMLGHDFLAFYTGGHFVRTEQLDKLYDLEAIKQLQRQIIRAAGLQHDTGVAGFAPFWNPPFAALPLAPLTELGYSDALTVWMIINCTVMVLALAVLVKMLGTRDWKTWALVPLFFFSCMPFIQAMTHGQNTFITLGLMLAVVILWRNEMPLAAGMVAGLLMYKPQHAAIVALVLVCSMGRRAILGLAVTGVWLLALNITALPGTLEAFLTKMPANLTAFQEAQPYYWERHMTFKALWRLLIQDKSTGPTAPVVLALWFASMAPFGLGLLIAAWREGGRKWIGGFQEFIRTERTRDRLIAATIAAAPLLMPFSFDYDLLLMAIPAVLWARELNRDRKPLARVDRICLAGFIGLYLWSFINPAMAGRLRVNVSVLFVAMIAGSLVWRSLKREAAAVEQEESEAPADAFAMRQAA